MASSVKEIRENKGLSQLEAAVLAGVALNTWRDWELGKKQSPKSRFKCEAATQAMRAALEAA